MCSDFKNNVVTVNEFVLSNIIIVSDMFGNHIIKVETDIKATNLKYNRVLCDQLAYSELNKNVVIVDDKKINDCLIISDSNGKSELKNISDHLAKTLLEEIFFANITEAKLHERQHKMIEFLESKRKSLYDVLHKGSEQFKQQHYRKASKTFRDALETIKNDKYPDEFRLNKNDLLSIKYALVISDLATEMSASLKSALELADSLAIGFGQHFPFLYLTLAQIHLKLYNFQQAKHSIDAGLKWQNKCKKLVELQWPGTKDVIIETKDTKSKMLKVQNQCLKVHPPDVRCCFEKCQKLHPNVYFNSPDFNGYVNVKCSNQCNLNYHLQCWKIKLKSHSIKNLNNFLSKPCETNACGGLNSEVNIFNEYALIVTSKVAIIDKNKNDTNENIPLPSNQKNKETSQDKIPNKQLTKKVTKDKDLIKVSVKEARKLQSTLKPASDCNNKMLNVKAPEFIPVHVKVKTKYSQTESVENRSDSTKIFKEQAIQTDGNHLKNNNEVLNLQKELFKAEEAYNNLLLKYKILQQKENNRPIQKKPDTRDSMSQTDLILNTEHKMIEKRQNEKIAALKTTVEELQESNEILITILIGQMKCYKNFYQSYLHTFEDKCKTMLWELSELMQLPAPNSVLSANDFQENINLWYKTLNDAGGHQQNLNAHYDELLTKLKTKQFKDIQSSPLFPLMIEPRVPFMNYLKSLLMQNRELNDDLRKYIIAVAQLSAKQSQFAEQQRMNDSFMRMSVNVPAANFSLDNNAAAAATVTATTPTISSGGSSGPLSAFRKRMNSSNDSNSIQINKDNNMENPEMEQKNELRQLYGIESLAQELQKVLPTTPLYTLMETLQELRQIHGGLSKMTKKEICVHVKKLLHQKSTQEEYLSSVPKSKEPAWSNVSSNHKWRNENPDLHCTICFDYMLPSSRIQLRCQHMFHVHCIKTWLQTDSVCPICRTFTTLDDEYPPLS